MLYYHPENDVCVLCNTNNFTIIHMPQAANWGYTDNWLDLTSHYPVSMVIQDFDRFMQLYHHVETPHVLVYGRLSELMQYIPANVYSLAIYDAVCGLSGDDFPLLRKLQCKMLYIDDYDVSDMTHITADEVDSYEISMSEPEWVDIASGVSRLLIGEINGDVFVRLDWNNFQYISVDNFNGILILSGYARHINEVMNVDGILPGTWGVNDFISSDINGDDIVLDADRYMCINMSAMCI